MNAFKKKISLSALLLVTLFTVPAISRAETKILDTLIGDGKKCNYVKEGLYLPFSGVDSNFPLFGKLVKGECVDVTNNVGDMFVFGFKVFLGLVSIIAVVNISVAGIQYIIQEKDIPGRRGAKARLLNSVVGLIIAVSGYVILSTVNPRLTIVGFDLKNNPLTDLVQQGANDAANIGVIPQGECTQGTAGCNDGSAPGTGGSTIPGGSLSDDEQANFIKQRIEQTGLSNLNPKDLNEFFPDGKSSPENWLRLIEEVARKESGFKAGDLYAESFGKRPPAGTPGAIPLSQYPKGSNSGKLSVGLLSLSWDDPEVLKKGYTEQDLLDPVKNLDVGVAILKRTVESGGCIACGNSGAASYWSVLRGQNKTDIINALRK